MNFVDPSGLKLRYQGGCKQQELLDAHGHLHQRSHHADMLLTELERSNVEVVVRFRHLAGGISGLTHSPGSDFIDVGKVGGRNRLKSKVLYVDIDPRTVSPKCPLRREKPKFNLDEVLAHELRHAREAIVNPNNYLYRQNLTGPGPLTEDSPSEQLPVETQQWVDWQYSNGYDSC